MEKIKLLNGNEYNAKEFAQIGDDLRFTVLNLPDFFSFRSELTPENIGSVEVYSEGDALCAVFDGYTHVTGKFGIEEATEGIDITVYLRKPDETAVLREEVAALKEEVEALKALQV
ncbi:MAG: hypothetical protein K0R34_4317 [Herbinix sp.]|jgi:hypothetical protein|nr:hypothetical protein [Herbinix sp.]